MYVTMFAREWGQKTSLTKLVIKRSNSQSSIFPLGMLIFLIQKILLILYPWSWNSINGNATLMLYDTMPSVVKLFKPWYEDVKKTWEWLKEAGFIKSIKFEQKSFFFYVCHISNQRNLWKKYMVVFLRNISKLGSAIFQ